MQYCRLNTVCLNCTSKYNCKAKPGALWPGDILPIFRYHQIFGNFNLLSETFRNFSLGKDKGFEFYWKIFELGPRYFTGPTTSLGQAPVPWNSWMGLVVEDS